MIDPELAWFVLTLSMELDMRTMLARRTCGRLATAFSLLTSALAAQTPRAESAIHPAGWIVGGTGSLDVANSSGSQSSLSLSPQGLFFLNNRLAVGGEGLLGLVSSDAGHSTAWGIGPTARLFLGDVSGRILPFFSATVLPEWTHAYQHGVGVGLDERILTLDGSFGTTFMLTSRAGLTGEAYATHFDLRESVPFVDGTTGQTHTGTSLSGSTHYGVRFGFTVFVH